jgi:hypothetical protein
MTLIAIAVFLASCTTVVQPPATGLQNGDIIFHTSKSGQSKVIQLATGSDRQAHHSARAGSKARRKKQEKIVSLDTWLLRIDDTNIQRSNNLHVHQLTTGESDLIDGLILGTNGDWVLCYY